MPTESTGEAPVEPELPICDAHHHLWQRPPRDYLLDALLEDLGSGHKVVSTVAIECRYGYRTGGPEELRPVGETEFLENLAKRANADGAIKTRIAAAIVGHADLTLADQAPAVLEAHRAARCAATRRRACSRTANFAAALPVWPSSISVSMPGSIIRNFRNSPTWPGPFPR
jgi:L-fuconolactonase